MALRKPTKLPTPSNWASLKPFGLGEQRPNNYREVFRAVRENSDNAGYAMRILREGVCDGCALGTKGLSDWTIPGVHLCNIRLRLLRLNTMGPIADAALGDVSQLSRLSNEELHALGRVPYPLLRRRGEPGFSRISWDEATTLVAERLRELPPDEVGFFLTSRGITNETYYVMQKLSRIAGSPHVDTCARLCHAASTVGLKESLGFAAPTISLSRLGIRKTRSSMGGILWARLSRRERGRG